MVCPKSFRSELILFDGAYDPYSCRDCAKTQSSRSGEYPLDNTNF